MLSRISGHSVRFGFICAVVLALPLATAHAESLTAQDCREGSEFIRNAALSRDNGLSAEAFLDRLEADFVMLRHMPTAARWFAYSDIEEHLLRVASRAVFKQPKDAGTHEFEFLGVCNTVRSSVTYRDARLQ